MSWRFSTPEVGTIVGNLNDEDGTAVTSAAVTLSNGMTTMTDENGRFVFENVTVGSYTISFVKDGYQTITADISVKANETTGLTAMIAESAKTVTPADHTPLIVASALGAVVVLSIVFALYRRRH
jgi:uncharacterized membrane protein